MKIIRTLLMGAAFVALIAWAGGTIAQEPGHAGHDHGEAAVEAAAGGEKTVKEMEGNICPVMGMPINKKHSYVYKGTKYYFCCPACVAKFKVDPEKYIQKKTAE